jgi:hypothetical protein
VPAPVGCRKAQSRGPQVVAIQGRIVCHLCQELAYSRFAESSQGLLLWLDQSFALYLSHPSIVNIIIVVPPITACASSYDYQLLPQTHNLDNL